MLVFLPQRFNLLPYIFLPRFLNIFPILLLLLFCRRLLHDSVWWVVPLLFGNFSAVYTGEISWRPVGVWGEAVIDLLDLRRIQTNRIYDGMVGG